MNKPLWIIKLAEKEYTIKVNRKSFVINDIKYPAKDCLTFKKYIFFKEYRLPIPEAAVDVAISLKQVLIVDGIEFATGKKYHRVENVPGWTWVFIALLLPLILGGAIGGCFLALGAILTLSTCAHPENSTRKKVLISLLTLPAMWGATFLLALMFEIVMGLIG